MANDLGNDVRLASWADILLYVPGYLLLFVGVFALLQLATNTPPDVRFLAAIGGGLAVAAAVADQLENLFLQLSLGTVDLS